MLNRKSFELRALREDHWVVEAIFAGEEEAKAKGESYLATNAEISGYQVVQIWTRLDGTENEKLLHEKRLSAKRQKPLHVVPIDEVPPCESRADFLALPARIAMGRLLRQYLDQYGLIPSELLYNYGIAKRFMDGDLYAPAVDRVATLQVRGTDKDARDRRDELYRELESIAIAVSRIEGRKVIRRFSGDSLAEIMELAEFSGDLSGDESERDVVLNVLLCKTLVGHRSLVGKLEKVMEWLEQENSRKIEPALDGILAEIITSATVIQDLLGNQRNLAAALICLLTWMRGTAIEVEGTANDAIATIGRLFTVNRLPTTHGVLFDFVLRQLGGKQPLARNDPSKEDQEFSNVLDHLFDDTGLIGGPAMAEALARRFFGRLKVGGKLGEQRAMEGVYDFLGIGNRRLAYLIALKDAPLGQEFPSVIEQRLTMLCANARSSRDFCDGKMSPKDRLVAMKRLHEMVETSTLEDEQRMAVLEALDHLVEDYLLEEKIIEKLDNPDEPLRDRAVRMVRFCSSGVLWEKGRAMTRARQRVVEHLRQPSFVENFTADEPDTARKEALVRDFYRLLAEAGFKS